MARPSRTCIEVFRSDPSVDEPTVIPDLIAAMLNIFDDMQVLVPRDLAKDDITNFQHRGIARRYPAELTGFDPAGHRLAVRTKRNRFAGAKSFDVTGRPAHQRQAPITGGDGEGTRARVSDFNEARGAG